MSGLHGNGGQINYSTAKMGVVGMTKTVAKEWGPFGIRCNAVAFGTIRTRLTTEKTNQTMKVDGNTEVTVIFVLHPHCLTCFKVTLGIPKAVLDNRSGDTGIPRGYPGEPIEGANAILFLCSPLSSYVNGHCLEVTGGSHL